VKLGGIKSNANHSETMPATTSTAFANNKVGLPCPSMLAERDGSHLKHVVSETKLC
jgi:hypothetical protein